MIFFLGKKFAILLIIFLLALSGNSQQVFFKSGQTFTSEQLNNFYSSISMEGDLLLFSANDYNLYCYNKPDVQLKWTSETSYKSNTPPYISGNMIMGLYILSLVLTIHIKRKMLNSRTISNSLIVFP